MCGFAGYDASFLAVKIFNCANELEYCDDCIVQF